MAKPTRKEYLQSLADKLRTDKQYEFEIQFRGRGGWWGEPNEVRWIGDAGEFLGMDWREAEKAIKSLLG